MGDINEGRYGMEAPGFPVSYEREARERQQSRVSCPTCGKRVKKAGLEMHIKAKHHD